MVFGPSSHINYSQAQPYPGLSVRLNKPGNLNLQDARISEKVDPELIMQENVPYFSREKISKKERQIDDGVRRKKIHDEEPYGVKEKHFKSRAKAEQFVLKAQEGLAPLLNPDFIQAQAQNEMPPMPADVIDIPVYQPEIDPKRVTIVKTNRFNDAVQLFWETKQDISGQEEAPKKPSLFSKIGKWLKPKQRPQQPLNREVSSARNDHFDRDEFIDRLAREQWYTYGF